MKNLTMVLMVVATFTSVGCKKKGGAGEAMAKMSELKDKMCACKDKKCADEVQDQMNKWSAENAKNAGDKAEKPDEKTMKEMQEVGTKYGECMAKAMGGGETPPPPPPEGSAGSAAEGSGSAAPAADAPKVGEGPVVPLKTLQAINLPPFPGVSAPDKASWKPVDENDGDRQVNYKDSETGYVSVRFLDCNLPVLKNYIAKKPDERGDFSHCFVTPAADAPKVKTYPRLDTAKDVQVVIKVGHVVLISGIWGGQEEKIKKDDLAKYLESVDFSSIEK